MGRGVRRRRKGEIRDGNGRGWMIGIGRGRWAKGRGEGEGEKVPDDRKQ